MKFGFVTLVLVVIVVHVSVSRRFIQLRTGARVYPSLERLGNGSRLVWDDVEVHPFLVSLRKSTTRSERERMERELKFRLLSVVDARSRTYFVRITRWVAEAKKHDLRIRWIVPYHPGHKVDNASKNRRMRRRTDRNFEEFIVVTARLLDSEAPDSAEVLRRLKSKLVLALDGVSFETLDPSILLVTVPMHLSSMAKRIFAESPLVIAVEERERHEMMNRYGVPAGQSDASVAIDGSGINVPLWRRGITGEGQIVSLADSGIDYDSCYFVENSSSSVPIDYCDFKRRKVVCYFNYSGSAFDEFPWWISGHGTHTAGTLAGAHLESYESGSISVSKLLSLGNLDNGHAPGAKIAFVDIGVEKKLLETPPNPGQSDLFLTPYVLAGARIFSQSWGCASENSESCFRYSTSSRSVDQFAWDHQDALVVFAAGNNGREIQPSVSAPGTAKNILSVGATQTTWGFASGGRPRSDETVADFSSFGPTEDFRVKPDLVFLGDEIRSASSTGSPVDGPGAAPCLNGSALTNLNAGTSMATPGVAGLATLLRQYLMEYNPFTGRKGIGGGPLADGMGPSGALMKAMLINCARPLTGEYFNYSTSSWEPIAERGIRRKDVEGYGRPALSRILRFEDTPEIDLAVFDRYAVDDGEKLDFVFDLNESALLKVTLVWTDPPSFGGQVLVNNLDLMLHCDGVATCGLGEDPLESRSTTDNVEQWPPDGEPAQFPNQRLVLTVTVDGVGLASGPQPFALVVSGRGFAGKALPDPNWSPSWSGDGALASNTSIPSPTGPSQSPGSPAPTVTDLSAPQPVSGLSRVAIVAIVAGVVVGIVIILGALLVIRFW